MYDLNIQSLSKMYKKLIFYPVLIITIITNVLNVILQAALVFGFKTGVAGAAISLLVANLFQLVALVAYIYKTKLYVSTWPGNFSNLNLIFIISTVCANCSLRLVL
jgi:Na+-driven multidrug efflux pump